MQNAGDEYACLWMRFAHVFVCAYLCVCMVCVVVSCISENVCTVLCGCTRICVQIFRQRDRGVCKGVSVYDDGKAGLLSFNIVLVGHWAICKCTELTAEAQSSLVHPPTSSTTAPPSIPPTVCLSCLTDGSCCPTKQRHKLSGAISSSQSLCWWAERDRVQLTCANHFQRDWYFCNTWTTFLYVITLRLLSMNFTMPRWWYCHCSIYQMTRHNEQDSRILSYYLC